MRETIRLKLFQLDEVSLQRQEDFEYTEEDRSYLENEIERLIHGAHILDEQGRVYVLSVASIKGEV